MPKNQDLITDINAEATAKGVDVPVTEGKNNAELVTILKDLKTVKAPPPPAASDQGTGDGETGDDDKTNPDDDDADDEPVLKGVFCVAPGVSITAKGARILADGDEITKNDIPANSFKAFRKSGHIVKG